MKTATLRVSLGAALALFVLPTFAAPHTPAKGSAERTAIMNALHRVLGKGRHKPLVTAMAFHVERGWAFVEGDFVYTDGAPLEGEYTEGPGTHFSAILHKEGKSWRVKRRLYHGDVVLPEFIRDFPQAPRAIFRDN